MFWDAKLGMFYFPLLFMRSGWRTQCVDAAVEWPVICFIHFNCCLEAGFEWFWGFWCYFQFSIALPENWNDVEIFGGRPLCVSIAMDLKSWIATLLRLIATLCLLIWLIAVASGKWFCAGLVLRDASLGVSRYAVSTPSTDGLFFAWGFLRGMRADKTLDALSSRSAWFGPSLRPTLDSLPRGPRPYRFGSDNRGWFRTNAWQFSTFREADCLNFE